MGMPAARLQDFCSGHGCYPPRPSISASTDVFVNSRGFHCLGDSWETHCCKHCHSSTTCRRKLFSSHKWFISSKS